MNRFFALVLVVLFAMPAFAAPRFRESREPIFIKIIKRVFGISTSSNLPTVPKP